MRHGNLAMELPSRSHGSLCGRSRRPERKLKARLCDHLHNRRYFLELCNIVPNSRCVRQLSVIYVAVVPLHWHGGYVYCSLL